MLEVNPETSRIVYCWTTCSTKFPETTRKLRDIITAFKNVKIVSLDLGGGGQTVVDLLADPSMLKEGEELYVPFEDIDSGKSINGKKILDPVVFNPKWIAEANHSMRSDLEHGRLLFPCSPGEKESGGDPYYYDKVDAVYKDILALKDEICKIEITATKTGQLHFDLPNSAPRSARKDRYSSCYRDWETDRKSTRLNSSHSAKSRMPSSA